MRLKYIDIKTECVFRVSFGAAHSVTQLYLFRVWF